MKKTRERIEKYRKEACRKWAEGEWTEEEAKEYFSTMAMFARSERVFATIEESVLGKRLFS